MKFFKAFQVISVIVLAGILSNFFVLPLINELIVEGPDKIQYRCPQSRGAADPSNWPRPNPGTVRLIRLTDSGQFVDRCELTDAVLEMVWEEGRKKPPVKAGSENLPRLAILYVHGWKHSASSTDSDFDHFKNTIKDWAEYYKGKKYVFGVYVGWNGGWGYRVLDWLGYKVFENLTFWTKKSTADRIAQSAVVTKIVSVFGATRNSKRGDQVFAIGHSFGARLLFGAAGQTLISDIERAHPNQVRFGSYPIVTSSVDALLLLNPAFESSLYSTFNNILRNTESFPDSQPPLIVAVSSTADWATRFAFPFGQWLGGARTDLEYTTLGNFVGNKSTISYVTHTLKTLKNGQSCNVSKNNVSEGYVANEICLTRISSEEKSLYLSADSEPTPIQPNNPFIVARADEDIISGHNDIWKKPFQGWLFQLIQTLERKNSSSKN